MTSRYDSPVVFRSMDDIRKRKAELRRDIDRDNEKMSKLWNQMTAKPQNMTQGEKIANWISNGAMAIDAFLMVRKLRRNHSGLFSFFSRKK